MNINKNTLIAIVVIAIGGIVLYQFLFNFIFPIALLFVLLYVLKLLIKGFDNNYEVGDFPFVGDNDDFSSDNQMVPIQPVDITSDEEV
ncbi:MULTISPECIES: hypothetical protein [Prochlorococcus]|uniref:Uncharacterized protein n=1 Tax=Prochlorococcus marinus (strain SARG / CCMP1375 / SS120) TaxID=167539 RepID=Q7VAG4_PROMA|nr:MULTISPECIES: hypothetical protein [Prochlorococcus]AAQ00543.1 Predicted protein [Prochlorococcus marinus subsp. marinus str. CCMP1375]KGG10286.1 hypothetical protein EV04_1952 [Prochlorococcus marinus str. LG]KGG22628.1 hypothetical protein EV08_0043 [Prochlorococcus marinus str. SS2]KGG24220.1 hypothetical protein EV09_0827 [Prochlorococcus marinus str. SS35]KGG33167.1 hypothetical protein EV10_0800 [Prochlorococcus marinus str. SS51]